MMVVGQGRAGGREVGRKGAGEGRREEHVYHRPMNDENPDFSQRFNRNHKAYADVEWRITRRRSTQNFLNEAKMEEQAKYLQVSGHDPGHLTTNSSATSFNPSFQQQCNI